MPEASITAHLPTMDIELMRRSLPEQDADLIAVLVRATPAFAAIEHWLAQSPPLPFEDVLQWWADMVRAAWQPWLALNPALALWLAAPASPE
ncbi:hypothetical protein CupriaWKF_14385 [Cupriavidus sp. WKF15]|uniref:hypothetical protein n=1 Tax=Cupriavidus sp. WKF15 TaxID=3032282 RepID=UPI0023E3049A|nr:hypothetical protein [Cupriavidus sp. WKF15]WER45477.1 hypothetical protein CupriaWKF_14385 [Cupriavidus sp. WKF15]